MKKFFLFVGKHKVAVTVVTGLLVVATISGVLLSKRNRDPERFQQMMQNMTNTSKLEKMDLMESVSATGTIQSAKSKIISAPIQNIKIKKILVKEGEMVKKGDVLVTFDTSDLEDTYDEAVENLSDVKEQTNREVSSAYSKYIDAKKQSKQEKAKQNGSVEDSVDAAKESYENAVYNRKKSLKEANKSVMEAKKALDQCDVVATMDGTITSVSVSAGDTYSGGDLFEISDLSKLQIQTSVNEYDINKVKKGQDVVIMTDATGDDELKGSITFVSPTTGSSSLSESSGTNVSSQMSAGSSSSNSGSGYGVKITIKTKDERLRVGMTGKCSLVVNEAKDVFAVPYDAISKNRQNEDVIYVLDKDQRREVIVTKGMESDYYTEISGGDLSEGLEVVIPSDEADSSSRSDLQDSQSSDKGDFGRFAAGSGGGEMGRPPSGGGPGGVPGMN